MNGGIEMKEKKRMNASIIMSGLMGVTLLLSGCQSSESPMPVGSPPKPVTVDSKPEPKTEVAPQQDEYKEKAKETVELMMEAMKKEDIALYKTITTTDYQTMFADQTAMMFENLDLDYQLSKLEVEAADSKGAVVHTRYLTTLRSGNKASFSDNESAVTYVLVMQDGEYKIAENEVTDVVFTDPA